MSVILDALKKLDREKSIRQRSTANIAVEILKPDLPRPKNKSFLYFVTICLTAIGAVVVTYFSMAYFQKKPSPPSPTSSSYPIQKAMPAPPEQSLPVKSSTSETIKPPPSSQPTTSVSLPRETGHEIKKESLQLAPQLEVPPQGKASGKDKGLTESKPLVETKPLPSPLDEKKTIQAPVPEKKDVAPESPPRKPSQTAGSPSAMNPSLLKVSAIVWYEEPSMRFAMINGVKATEGSIIEGMKVVEIKPTSVRLSHNEGYFELFIDR